jgi:hypothetical protein
VNEITRVPAKRRAPGRARPAPADMSWGDRLEPLDPDAAALDRPGAPIPPGYYTPETLPPLGEGAKAILASIDAVAPLVDVRGDPKSGTVPGITLEDEGMEGIRLSDDGLPGIDPGR